MLLPWRQALLPDQHVDVIVMGYTKVPDIKYNQTVIMESPSSLWSMATALWHPQELTKDGAWLDWYHEAMERVPHILQVPGTVTSERMSFWNCFWTKGYNLSTNAVSETILYWRHVTSTWEASLPCTLPQESGASEEHLNFTTEDGQCCGSIYPGLSSSSVPSLLCEVKELGPVLCAWVYPFIKGLW